MALSLTCCITVTMCTPTASRHTDKRSLNATNGITTDGGLHSTLAYDRTSCRAACCILTERRYDHMIAGVKLAYVCRSVGLCVNWLSVVAQLPTQPGWSTAHMETLRTQNLKQVYVEFDASLRSYTTLRLIYFIQKRRKISWYSVVIVLLSHCFYDLNAHSQHYFPSPRPLRKRVNIYSNSSSASVPSQCQRKLIC